MIEEKEFVNYILRHHSIDGEFIILHLKKKNWKRISKERLKLDIEIYKLLDTIHTLPDTTDLPEEEHNMLNSVIEMENEIKKEYKSAHTFDMHLNSVGMFFLINDQLMTKRITRACPYLSRIMSGNKDKSFIILLNDDLLSFQDPSEKFITIAHETLHYVEGKLGERSAFSNLEALSVELYTKFSQQVI